jgi:hypothetical protein
LLRENAQLWIGRRSLAVGRPGIVVPSSITGYESATNSNIATNRVKRTTRDSPDDWRPTTTPHGS